MEGRRSAPSYVSPGKSPKQLLFGLFHTLCDESQYGKKRSFVFNHLRTLLSLSCTRAQIISFKFNSFRTLCQKCRGVPSFASASATNSQSRSRASRLLSRPNRLPRNGIGPRPSKHTCTTPAAGAPRTATAGAATRPRGRRLIRRHAPTGMPRRARAQSAR